MLRNAAAALALTISAILVLPSGATAQAAPQAEHLVVRGNTLWDLAQHFYGNPFDWRRIWNANRERVANPDLIFPGQVLLIPDREGNLIEVIVMPGEAPAGDGPTGRPPEPEGIRRTIWYDTANEAAAAEPAYASAPAVSALIVYGSPFLVDSLDTGAIGEVTAFGGANESRITRESARVEDHLFIEVDRSLPPGTLLQAYRIGQSLSDYGNVARPTAVVSVQSISDGRHVVRVEQSYGRLLVGDLLRPIPMYEARPGVHPQPVEEGSKVTVMGYASETAVLRSQGEFLFIEAPPGVVVGDIYEVRLPGSGVEPEGIFQIVFVEGGFATGRILNLRSAIFDPGIEATLARKMPAG
ncbi:MAG: LysM peptidoglycan-binding domain-containing protein [Longimicrobiales bacterium]|nr:LysM peptidoglycan-binding domain-containing protein [Longimicrobiales bacterium]